MIVTGDLHFNTNDKVLVGLLKVNGYIFPACLQNWISGKKNSRSTVLCVNDTLRWRRVITGVFHADPLEHSIAYRVLLQGKSVVQSKGVGQ